MTAERGAAVNTIAAYGRDLESYLAYLAATGSTALIAATGDIRGYIATFDKAQLSPSTAARRLSSIRQFHQFLFVD